MARQRSLIAPGWLIRVWVLIAVLAWPSPGADTAQPPAPIGTRPYAIRAQVSFDPSARVDPSLRLLVINDWLNLIHRFVGDPWRVDAIDETPSLATGPVESLGAEALKPLGGGVDKVWVIQIRRSGPTLVLEGREYDVLTGRLGEVHRTDVRDRLDLPRGLLTLAQSVFEPVAEVGESRAGGVSFTVQGGAIDPANPAGAVAPVGSVFRAFRLFLGPDKGVTEIREIPYSYFRVEERVGALARCSIIKGLGDPLTGRYARANRLVALGIQPAMAHTRLRFLLKGDKSPAAGYKLVARAAEPDAKPFEVGITDRDGRVELPADFARGLVILRVIAGNDEPMADLPIMPGETRTERTVVFEGRAKTLVLEARLDALRDAIIDTVASRSRLEARMKARVEGEDWPGFTDSMAEFRKLTPRDQFDTQLRLIRTDAEQTEAATKTLILTKNARNLLDETQALLGRYFDDDLVRGLEETAAATKADRAAEAKDKSKTKKPKPK